MSDTAKEPGGEPRRGLVLGAGGVLGATWTIGALRALEEVEGWDPRTVDVVVGTSAGAVLAVALAAGIGATTLVNHQRGIVAPGDPAIEYDYDTASGGALPPKPRLRIGSPSLFLHSLPHFYRNPLSLFYALLPEGSGSLDGIRDLVETVSPGESWPQGAACWITAMDYETGERVVFGRDGAPPTSATKAVMASCAIPTWYAPVEIDGRRYVDGGAYSATSADLLAGRGLDEVTVLSPMASFRYDRPRAFSARAERRWRRFMTKQLLREAREVRHSGATVTMLGPGPEDLAMMGGNLMDPARREKVLETSLRTSAEALAEVGPTRLATTSYE